MYNKVFRPIPPVIRSYQNEGDRFFLAAPFLFGALAGGAIASVSRPRPVYVYPPTYYNQPQYPYGQTSYNYYYPVKY